MSQKQSSHKLCGTCAHRRNQVVLTPKFVIACSRVAYDPTSVPVETLALLHHAITVMANRKYRCREGWCHLFDRACAFWQPRPPLETLKEELTNMKAEVDMAKDWL